MAFQPACVTQPSWSQISLPSETTDRLRHFAEVTARVSESPSWLANNSHHPLAFLSAFPAPATAEPQRSRPGTEAAASAPAREDPSPLGTPSQALPGLGSSPGSPSQSPAACMPPLPSPHMLLASASQEPTKNAQTKAAKQLLSIKSPGGKKRGRKPIDKSVFKCMSCGTTKTPEWRKGPGGRNTLCNACGLRYKKEQETKQKNAAHVHSKLSIANLCDPTDTQPSLM